MLPEKLPLTALPSGSIVLGLHRSGDASHRPVVGAVDDAAGDLDGGEGTLAQDVTLAAVQGGLVIDGEPDGGRRRPSEASRKAG